ncbi:hypothetical protein PIROE2DRAFT_9579 [Piromyces sp. E2]|nr:hypothetical protein PIROE2DRAFT_9579 [Piromyces sp. E2]|eukprot:OUM63838.1 hypothetical protein PIROE2DRAFT_9579 [Piromyces sp. E2]
MKFLSLLIFLAIHAYTALARYDVYFGSNFHMYIDSLQAVEVRDCRFNSSEVVYCEALIPGYYPCSIYDDRSFCMNSYALGGSFYIGYRLRFDLTLKGYTEKCRESFKSTSHFKDNYLMNERGANGNLIDLKNDCINLKLPDTFYPSKKHFKFITKNNCVFYGYINKVTATKI